MKNLLQLSKIGYKIEITSEKDNETIWFYIRLYKADKYIDFIKTCDINDKEQLSKIENFINDWIEETCDE